MLVRNANPGRRRLLELAGKSCAAALVAGLLPGMAMARRKPLFSAIGIAASIDRATELQSLGADFIVESVAAFLVPFASDAEFAANLGKARSAPLRVRGCNSFLRDPSLICVGPAADHPRVLQYAGIAFERLAKLGGEYIVFGSSGARQIPAGWSKAQADEQFVALLRAMAPLANARGITLGVEMQRRQECNYLNRIDEVVHVVAAVDHPNVRVLADLYHMQVMGDTPEDLARAMPWVGMVELAERETRTLPGVAGDDFRPYFAALYAGGFSGLADIEADGTPAQLRQAFATVHSQARDARRPRK